MKNELLSNFIRVFLPATIFFMTVLFVSLQTYTHALHNKGI